jgi:hypothetical protein
VTDNADEMLAALKEPKPKRRRKRKPAKAKQKRAVTPAVAELLKRTVDALAQSEKPKLGLPDPLEAAQEAARLAQEGSLKLSRAVDALRATLETIVIAEVDNSTGMPTTTRDLRGIAIAGLNEYSRISGQSWKRHKLVGNWAGGTGNKPVHEREMEG